MIEFYDDAERYPKQPEDGAYYCNLIETLARADASHKQKAIILLALANTEAEYARQDGDLSPEATLPVLAESINQQILDMAEEFWTHVDE